MSKIRMAGVAAAVLLSLPLAGTGAQAAPAAAGLSLAAPLAQSVNNEGLHDQLTQVQWRRGGGYRRGPSPGAIIGGLAAGAIIGGAIAASRPSYGYGYAPGYYAPAPAPYYAPAPAYDADDAYCMQRYKSYDPRSGTYLNYDGNRYPCP